MTKFLLPVPTHTVGTNLITVQYDIEMIPYLVGLLNASGQYWNFDSSTGDRDRGQEYIDTLIEQLTTKKNIGNSSVITFFPNMLEAYYGNLLLQDDTTNPPNQYVNYFYAIHGDISGAYYLTSFNLEAGDYRLFIPFLKSTNHGYWRYELGGQELVTLDQYASPTVVNSFMWTNAITLPSGDHEFKLSSIGKNPLSTGYYGAWTFFVIKKVG